MPSFHVATEGAVTHVTFDDGAMNLLSADALGELERIIAAAATGVVTLRSGRAPVFAAGADMNAMQQFDGSAASAFAAAGQRVFAAIETAPALTIALVDGDCYGGALDLTLAFDIRVATRRSRFAHPGSRIGIVTGFGGTRRVPDLRERRLLTSLMLDNAVVDADRARDWGLIDAVASDCEELDALAVRLAQNVTPEVKIAKALRRTSVRGARERLVLARRTEELWRGSTDHGRA